ncbi:MAG: DUF4411 family protein [Geminicoccaceae bacterium]|nr:DUF4411 family protein [Geminicoccaceae bacterium]
MILVDTNVVIRSYEGAEALLTSGLTSGSTTGPPHPPADPLGQVDAVWRSLLKAGKVGTIVEVLQEVMKEPSMRWRRIIENDFPHCIAQQTERYYDVLGDIDAFVRKCWPSHHADLFLKGADPHLVAMAATNGWAVATLESPGVPRRGNGAQHFSDRVMLPYVAWQFGVPVKTIYDLFTAPARR